jgi:hypothetical protein
MGRESTLKRWHSEGLPADVSDINEYAYRQVGGNLDWPKQSQHLDVNQRMIPQFEEKVIERTDRTQIVQDWKGNICEIGGEFTVEYLRNAIDFVTRRWIKCPVESRAGWEDMKARYNPDDPSRLPDDFESQAAALKPREHVACMELSGPFWQLREWLGFENLCMMFHDDPAFVREMIAFWEDFVSRLLTRTFRHVVPDYVLISEDMAYKGFSMISPAMVRKFLLPTWTRWGRIIRGAGCPVYAIDSDGYIGELIPLWIKAGLNACEPIEVAAGCDLVEFHRQYPRKIAYWGGVDKRAIAVGGTAIEKEIARLKPVIDAGGFIPSCDHGIPSDVSWPDFLHYVRALAQATGWL